MRLILLSFSLVLFFNLSSGEDSLSYHPEFFANEYLQPQNFPKLELADPLSRDSTMIKQEIAQKSSFKHGRDILFLSFLGASMIFLIFKVFNRRLYILYRNAFSNFNLFTQLIREKRPSPIIWTTLLMVGRCFVFAATIYLLIDGHFGISNIRLIGILFGLFYAFWSVKYIFSFLLGMLIHQKEKVRTYYLQHHIIFSGLAAILLPFCFIVFFAEQSIQIYATYVLLIVVVIGLLYYLSRYIMLLRSFRQRGDLLFFMYLCAFELMPILVLMKWIGTHIST